MKNNEVTAKSAIEAFEEANIKIQQDMKKQAEKVEDGMEMLEDAAERLKKRNERLLNMAKEAREKVAGYEQLAKVHSAYISILLKRLGATEDNMLTITASEVTEALSKYEARAMPAEDGFSLYCEVIE